MTKQIVITTPAIRKTTSDFQTTLKHGKTIETNQRLAEANTTRFVVIKFAYVT